MTPQILATAIIPAALQLLPAALDSARARLLLVAIAIQESALRYRQQVGGPARGFWQFEQGGGVNGVLTHPATRPLALAVCETLVVTPTAGEVYAAIAQNDLLACCVARLLLKADAAALPDIGDRDGAWAYYQRNWRPGKPHPDKWPANYEAARQALGL
ncbi:hypothetical protein [Hydrocarboniphaga sp.]|uniref:hypothetical protein n=1 Tax=Hydrocarboniphaga sp. TaxID=2033016 RepID=UPI003D0EF77B